MYFMMCGKCWACTVQDAKRHGRIGDIWHKFWSSYCKGFHLHSATHWHGHQSCTACQKPLKEESAMQRNRSPRRSTPFCCFIRQGGSPTAAKQEVAKLQSGTDTMFGAATCRVWSSWGALPYNICNALLKETWHSCATIIGRAPAAGIQDTPDRCACKHLHAS